MNNGFQFFDIILFAMIAVFLILRLRSVLGRRDQNEGGFPEIFDRLLNPDKKPGGRQPPADSNIIQLAEKAAAEGDDADADTPEPSPQTPLGAGLVAIRAADPGFDPAEFVSGARMAFELILGAYAAGDSGALKPLLGTDVFANFDRSIRAREAAGQTMEETLVSIRSAEVVEAELAGAEAQITVKFVSEQVHALFDADGQVIEGDTNKVITVTDFWTFTRNTKARDPNWALAATRSLD